VLAGRKSNFEASLIMRDAYVFLSNGTYDEKGVLGRES